MCKLKKAYKKLQFIFQNQHSQNNKSISTHFRRSSIAKQK